MSQEPGEGVGKVYTLGLLEQLREDVSSFGTSSEFYLRVDELLRHWQILTCTTSCSAAVSRRIMGPFRISTSDGSSRRRRAPFRFKNALSMRYAAAFIRRDSGGCHGEGSDAQQQRKEEAETGQEQEERH